MWKCLILVLLLSQIQSFKFLYGCAVNAYVLRVNWLIDSIAAGSVLQLNGYACEVLLYVDISIMFLLGKYLEHNQ